MEKDKILKILEKVPLETKLYSTTFGQLKYNGTNYYTDGNQKISLITKNDVNIIYLPNGKYKEGGEVTLYPSKDMRNWDKFAWKEGDVLVDNEGNCCIFTGFLGGYPYVTFGAKLVLCNETVKSGILVEETRCWEKSLVETTEKYIKYIDTKLKESNRRVNPATLEIEEYKPEFKNGNILKKDSPMHKKGSDKPEHEFHPFEKVLVRDVDTDKWTVDLYGFKENNDDYVYQCVGGCCVYCIPYKGNEHLLGTTDDPN